MEEQPTIPAKNGNPNPPAGRADGSGHHYDVGPGFEIAVRSEGKHGVEVNVAKDADAEHKHGAVNRRLEHLEATVVELASRLAKVETEIRRVERAA